MKTHEEKQDEAIKELADCLELHQQITHDQDNPFIAKKINSILSEEDKEPTLKKKLEKNGNVVSIEEIKQFIEQEIKLALESVVPEERHLMGVLGDDDYLMDVGYNQAINEIKENIKHYLPLP